MDFSQLLSTSRISLLILDPNQELIFEGVSEIILGRSAAASPGRVEVDLTPYQAYQAGVSRQHAHIRIQGTKVTVTDLDSANGTRLNGKLLPPQSASEVKNADVLTLGTLKIKIDISNLSSGRT
jgi:pSer/pThr/pTyr-binding forkhead associated (FHA) protein